MVASATLWLWLVLASACTDPVFAPDAGTEPRDEAGTPAQTLPQEPMESGTPPPTVPNCEGNACGDDASSSTFGPTQLDGGANEAGAELMPDAALDETRMKWVGRYAARSALFAFDDPLKSSARLLSIVTIQPDESGGLSMEEEMCYYEGGWSYLFNGQLVYTFTNTRGTVKLNYREDGFDGEQLTLHIGYGASPADCRPGATSPRGEARPWLTSSTCDCPRNEDPPTSLRDCRVIDQESDRNAGATFAASIDTQTISYHVTQEERVALRAAYRLEGRIYADRFFEETTRVLECVIDGKTATGTGCPGGVAKPCPSKYNKVEMVRIDPPIKCEQVITMEQGLFIKTLPNYPQSCPSEVAGTAAAGLKL